MPEFSFHCTRAVGAGGLEPGGWKPRCLGSFICSEGSSWLSMAGGELGAWIPGSYHWFCSPLPLPSPPPQVPDGATVALIPRLHNDSPTESCQTPLSGDSE